VPRHLAKPVFHLRGITVGGRTYFAEARLGEGQNQVKLNGCQLCSASGDTFRTGRRLVQTTQLSEA